MCDCEELEGRVFVDVPVGSTEGREKNISKDCQ